MELQNKNELEKPIRISSTNNEELLTTLLYIFTLIGVPENKVPQGIVKDVLIDFIKTYHSALKLEEIKEAFSLAVAGKLETDLQLYDKMFNAELFGRVISLYKKYKAKEASDPKPFKREEKQKELLISPETSYQMFIRQMEELKQIPYIWNWDKIFKHLEDAGEIKDTNDEKGMFVENFKLKLKSEMDDPQKFNQILNDNLYFKTLCRRERIINYLKSKYDFL